MMSIGIISDIHADYEALQRALRMLVNHQVHKIICLGDIVEKGLNGDACVQMLQDWLIPSVRGNHDELAIDNQSFIDDDPRWQKLMPQTLAYLAELPLMRNYLWENQRLMLFHGSPDSVWEYLYTDTPAKRFKHYALSYAADFMLCGHTHEPMDIRYKGVRFLNPGSVCGLHTEGSRTCAILQLPAGHFNVLEIP